MVSLHVHFTTCGSEQLMKTLKMTQIGYEKFIMSYIWNNLYYYYFPSGRRNYCFNTPPPFAWIFFRFHYPSRLLGQTSCYSNGLFPFASGHMWETCFSLMNWAQVTPFRISYYASTHLDDTSGVVCVDFSAICCLCLEWQRSIG